MIEALTGRESPALISCLMSSDIPDTGHHTTGLSNDQENALVKHQGQGLWSNWGQGGVSEPQEVVEMKIGPDCAVSG